MASFTEFIFRRAADGDADKDTVVLDATAGALAEAMESDGGSAPPATAERTPPVSKTPDFTLEGSRQKLAVAHTEADAVVVGARIAARELDEAELDAERKPLDLVVVLDTSGSMSGGKLAMCKETLLFLLSELSARDRFALVEYDNYVRTALPLSETSDAFKTAAKSVITNLGASGGTNLSGGLFQGINIVRSSGEQTETPTPLNDGDALSGRGRRARSASLSSNSGSWRNPATWLPGFTAAHSAPAAAVVPPSSGVAPSAQANAPGDYAMDPGRVRSVLLMTDGQANDGITNPTRLAQATASLLRGSSISLHTFGYGTSHNADLLRSLAETGRGSYYFVETVEQVPGAFSDCLGGLLTTVAQNVVLRIQPQAPYTIHRLISQRTVQEPAGSQSDGVTVQIGDLYAGENIDFLVELACPTRSSPRDADPLMLLSADFVNLLAADVDMEHLKTSLELARPAELSPEQADYVDTELVGQLAREETAAAIAQATRSADDNDYDQAQAQLARAQAFSANAASVIEARGAAQETFAMMDQLTSDLQTTSEAYASAATYRAGGRSRAQNSMMNHIAQRGWTPAETVSYAKGGKRRMKTRMEANFS